MLNSVAVRSTIPLLGFDCKNLLSFLELAINKLAGLTGAIIDSYLSLTSLKCKIKTHSMYSIAILYFKDYFTKVIVINQLLRLQEHKSRGQSPRDECLYIAYKARDWLITIF